MMPWVTEVTADAIRHFAWGIGDNNPLWLDADYAAKTRWGGIVAPPCFPYAAHESTVAPALDPRHRVQLDAEWVWYDVLRLGTAITAEANLDSTTECSDVPVQVGNVQYLADHARRIASVTTTCSRPTALPDVQPPPPYERATLERFERDVLAEARTGNASVDLNAIPARTKGPVSIMDIVAWCAGTIGVPAADAGQSVGNLAHERVSVPQLTAWFAHVVTDWAGDDAFLHRLAVDVDRQPGLGSTTQLAGSVAATAEGAAELLLTARDHAGVNLASARALVLFEIEALPVAERAWLL